MPEHRIELTINGFARTLTSEPARLLLDVLRDDLGLTGTKCGCGIGVCGACTVMVDGRAASACLTLIGTCAGRQILTIEGLQKGTALHPLQQAFLDQGALQCGFCTPGQIMAAQALLAEDPSPSEEAITEGMLGNLCRCTGYYSIRAAVRSAAERAVAR